MRIVSSLLIALSLVIGSSAVTTGTASADRHEAVKREANEKGEEGKEKSEDAKEEVDKDGNQARDDAKAKAEARKEAQKARVEALKAARKERLLKQEEKRHAGQMKEYAIRSIIESGNARDSDKDAA